MIADLRAVVWKEVKEMAERPGGGRGGWVSLLVVVGVVGVFLPLRVGVRFFNVFQSLGLVMLPVPLIAAVIADSFAGERERHTLETLLASPLSDRAILFGKIAAAVVYGWGISMLTLLVSLVTVNLKYGQGRLLLFSAPAGAGVVLASFLMGLLMASIGVLVSLRASTVRQAQQTLSVGFLVVMFGGIFGLRALPFDLPAWLSRTAATTGAMALILAGAGIFLLVDLAVLGAAMARFRRSRLALD
jgi:ABC-2 type transport system permease protein